MRNLGIEFLGTFGLPPADNINLAADLGCQFISAVIEPMEYNPENNPRWSLRDAATRAALKAAIADRGVTLGLGEGMAIVPGVEVREAYAADLDIFAELGAAQVNAMSFEPDTARALDQLAAVVEMAKSRGIDTILEFVPHISPINTFALAVEAVRHAGNGATILVDTMHFFRSGGTIAELKASADLVGHIQLCDAPAEPAIPDYMEEALYERRIPGTGDAPLVEILAAVSPSLPVGLEIPLRSLVEQGIGVRERKRRCVEAARAVIAKADALAPA